MILYSFVEIVRELTESQLWCALSLSQNLSGKWRWNIFTLQFYFDFCYISHLCYHFIGEWTFFFSRRSRPIAQQHKHADKIC